jgi:hypothetical protein
LMIVAADGRVLDGLAYEGEIEGVGEGEPAPEDADSVGENGQPPRPQVGLSRCPDGRDTDDNERDFLLVAPTPGRGNTCP